MLAYDDLYSIEYFQRRERPWWRRKGAEASDLIRAARKEHDSLLARSRRFDEELTADLKRTGGDAYAGLATLAYRLLTFWLPLPLGGIAFLLHRQRYGRAGAAASATSP